MRFAKSPQNIDKRACYPSPSLKHRHLGDFLLPLDHMIRVALPVLMPRWMVRLGTDTIAQCGLLRRRLPPSQFPSSLFQVSSRPIVARAWQESGAACACGFGRPIGRFHQIWPSHVAAARQKLDLRRAFALGANYQKLPKEPVGSLLRIRGCR